MSSASGRADTEYDRGRRAAASPVAVMGPLEVVDAHELLERTVQDRAAGEVVTAENDPPVLVQDRLLQPLHETVGPRVPWLRPRVADAEGITRLIERPLEFRAAVGEHPAERPAGPAEERHE